MIPEYLFDSGFWSEFFGYPLGYKIQVILLNPELFVIFALPLGGLLYVLIKIAFKAGPRRVTHGSASWGTIEDAQKAGLVVGYTDPAKLARLKKEKKPLPKETMWTTAGTLIGKIGDQVIAALYHTIFIAPPRAGKGTLILIQNLLAYPGSFVNNDIKGENYVITARRRREMGQTVYKFDPYNSVKDGYEAARFNPLDYINVEDGEVGYTRALVLANIIGDQDGKGENDFFVKAGKIVILLYILYTCAKCDKEIRNLKTVREFSMLPTETAKALFNQMVEMEEFDGEISRNAVELLTMIGDSDDPKVYLSVKFTVNTMLSFLGDKRVADALSATDFKPENFRYIPSSLYIIVDAANLEVSAMLMRMIYTYVIKLNMTMEPPAEIAELGLKMLKYPIKFFMDEFAQLKRFDIVQETMPLSAGYGVWFCIILQGVSQLKHFYKEGGEEFIENTTRIFMGAEGVSTAKVISESCGKTTVEQRSRTLIKTGILSCFDKFQISYSETARDLITVGEALQMQPEEPLLLKGKIKPLRLKATPYYENPEFNVKDKNGKEVRDEEGRVKKIYDEFNRF